MMRIFQNEDTVIKGFIYKSCLSFTSWVGKILKILFKSQLNPHLNPTLSRQSSFSNFAAPRGQRNERATITRQLKKAL